MSKKNNENNWSWYTQQSKIIVNSDPKYTFGFTGWTLETCGEWVDDLDPFEQFVRETQIANGIEPNPPRQKWVPKTYTSRQVLFNGPISVPAPKIHGYIRGFTDGSDAGTGQTQQDNEPISTKDE